MYNGHQKNNINLCFNLLKKSSTDIKKAEQKQLWKLFYDFEHLWFWKWIPPISSLIHISTQQNSDIIFSNSQLFLTGEINKNQLHIIKKSKYNRIFLAKKLFSCSFLEKRNFIPRKILTIFSRFYLTTVNAGGQKSWLPSIASFGKFNLINKLQVWIAKITLITICVYHQKVLKYNRNGYALNIIITNIVKSSWKWYAV